MKKLLTMKSFFCALAGSGLLLGGTLVAAGQQTLTPPRPGFSFPQKQTLTYSVDWRVFTVATATVHFEAAGDREQINIDAETSGAINMLYHLSDRFQINLDRNKGCTYELDKQAVEGRRQINSSIKVDYQRGIAGWDEKNLVTKQNHHADYGVPGCQSDLISGIFYAASQPMDLGHSFTVPVVDALRPVTVTMKVEGREEIHTPMGNFRTVRVQPTADAGVVKNRGNIWVWYTDDDRHLPVQMRARSFWGTITFRLTGMENK